MTIRQVNTTVTVPAPNDPYSTPTTFYAGQVLDVLPGGPWEAAIGVGNLTPMAAIVLADDIEGVSGEATDGG
jgi:hypothetical protein